MLTPWGEALDPERVLPEHPRPQLVRDGWMVLNGWWDHTFTSAEVEDMPNRWDGQILVPFSPEAPLSGVGRTLQPDEALWYRRTFQVASDFLRARLLLHFGAVDQDCRVWVDGVLVGEHRGGYLPFTFDITEALSGTEHEVVVRVRDVTDTSWRSRGKQTLHPHGIWYTAQSGIWQTVWLEAGPAQWVDRLVLVPHLADGELEVRVVPGGAGNATSAEVTVLAGNGQVGRRELPVGEAVRIPIPDVRPWSPEDPFLYDLEVTLGEDTVTSYAAMRSVGLGPDTGGRTRLLLNGSPYLHAGLLDQGYWPDGLLTAPSDEALVHDIRTAKDLGFTMLRKHIKVESLRWYHHCDRLGMLVWQDMVNGGRGYRSSVVKAPAALPLHLPDRWHRLFGRGDREGREEFLAEVEGTVELLESVPSVAVWVPFNEGWGQFDAVDVSARIQRLDPTRLVDHASGWHDQGGGDFASRHVYIKPFHLSRADAEDRRAAVLSEYGGYSHRVQGHAWSRAEFGYRRFADRAEFERAVVRLHESQVRPAVSEGLAGFVYTQLADVESETNGLMTYDRRVLKVDPARFRAVNAELRNELAAASGGTPTPVRVTEREITRPVSLTLPNGRLNPEACGWTRTPLITSDAVGRGHVGRGRNKRWEYWAVTTPTHVVSLVVSHLDYAALHAIWVLDRRTGETVGQDAILPFGLGASLPGTLGASPARARAPRLAIDLEEVPGGTRLRARGKRVRVDVLAHRPDGHESLGVVVPWSQRLFQYTVKDLARPATGTIWVDDRAVELPAGESWATLDHGRGRWPRRVHWNWGAGSGRNGDHVLGVQVGGRWTDGTGAVENSLLVDGRLHKISEELRWSYDTSDWLRPWQVSGESVDLTFTPEFVREDSTDLKIVASETHQCFGSWRGEVLGVPVDGIFGWAEDVRQLW